MSKRLVFSLILAGLTIAPALALNPQPEPPGRAIKLADGSAAILGTDHRVSHVVAGKRVFLPPGPCKLQNGVVLKLDPDGKALNFTDANGADGNMHPMGAAKHTQ